MIMNARRRGNSMGSGKIVSVFGEDILEVRMYRGCLNHVNDMKLGNNYRMTFDKDIFHSMRTDDLW
jgi:hypothetical protein